MSWNGSVYYLLPVSAMKIFITIMGSGTYG